MNQFFQMLKKDHAELKEILGQLEETKESAPKKREQLFQKLREELVPHMKAEESTFYPSLDSEERGTRRCYGSDGGSSCERYGLKRAGVDVEG